MAVPKIKDFCPEMWSFFYNSKCFDFKPPKCIGGEYKCGHHGCFDTIYMSVSITVLDIQHVQ